MQSTGRALALACAFALALPILAPVQAQIYVDTDATGNNDGSSWADAYTDLQTAIDAAGSTSELWVADGTYVPGSSEGDSFTIPGDKDGIAIYGGFEGTESSRSDRDPGAHPTVLSGDLDGDDTTNDDGVTVTAGGISGTNSFHVLILDGGNEFIGADVSANITGATVIDGVTITAGQADGGDAPHNRAGGLYCDGGGSGNECSPTLRNVVFAGNTAYSGGALYNDGFEATSSPSIANAVFTGNSVSGAGSQGNGGAIYNESFGGTSNPSITNATFEDNTAKNGGAIYTTGYAGTAEPQIANTILWGNSASSFGDEIYNNGGTGTISHSIVQGGDSGIANGTGFSDGTNNLDQDPQFLSASTPAGVDGTFASDDDGLNVRPGSAALDAGASDSISISEDITGAARTQDRDGDGTATVNIGAYEASPPVTVSGAEPSTAYPGHPVTISGMGLSGVSNVSYDGTSVNFHVVSDSELRTRVPASASADASFTATYADGSGASSSTISLDPDAPYGPERGLSLDDSGDYVSTGAGGDDLGLVNESFSIGVWFKPNSITSSGDDALVGMDSGTDSETLHLALEPGGEVVFGFYGDDLRTSSGPIQTGTWQHLTFVYDATKAGTDRYIYLNGKQIASNEASADFQGTSNVLIGRWGGGNYFDGEIDQVRVWEGALSASEVRERTYRTVAPGDAAFGELEAAWRFDATSSGSPAFGFSDGFRNGTFQGDPSRSASSGGRLGQASVSTTGTDATIGPSGGTLSATNVSTSGGAVQLYRFGRLGAFRDGSAAGDDLSGTPPAKRLDLTWGVATNGSPSADLTIDYSGLTSISGPVVLLRRDGPGDPWQGATGWSQDASAQTFTKSGTVSEGQYAVAPGQIYVDAGAGGANDGSSWTDAYTDLQTAIDAAASFSALWVAQGTYTPDSEGDSFTITGAKNGLEIYGGFDGTESSRSERDPQGNRTILSGDLNGDDADPDSDGVIEDDADLQGGENAHHVLVLDGGNAMGSNVSANVTGATVIDGLVVTAGQADGTAPQNDGGGLYCDGRGSGNACSAQLKGVVFTGNAASNNGGAIYTDGSEGGTGSPTITSAAFAGNAAASDGGAIYNDGDTGTSSPSITNTAITDNEASNNGGAIYNLGTSGTSSPQIINATFESNAASSNGGALYNDGSSGTAQPQIANTILWGNSASSGDELYNSSASSTISHSIVEAGDAGIANGTGFSDGTNNLDQDPAFVDSSTPAGTDGVFPTGDDRINVLSSSPALDAGDNGAISVSQDITGAARTQDRDGDGTNTVNIGAYEVKPDLQSPSVDGTTPTAVYPGHPVVLSGSAFVEASSVTYNGTSVPFTVEGFSKIRTRLPADASTDASFAVTTPEGTGSSPTVTIDPKGPYGPERGLALDGAGDYVSTGAGGDDLGLAGESFSIGVWLKPNRLGNRTLLGMDGGTTNETLHLVLLSDGSVRFGLYSNDLDAPSGTVSTGEWQHLTFVYDSDASGTDRYIYHNGTQVASDEASADFQGTGEVLIGRWGGDNYFDGRIDQVRVWKGALAAGEIRERAYRTVAPGHAAFSDLEAAYRFDAQGSGDPALEFTDAFRDGTFRGDASRTAFSGGRLGQEVASTTGSDATIGPSGGTLSATNVSASSGESIQLYRFGDASGSRRSDSDPGEVIRGEDTDKRSNLTWGLAVNGSPSADLTIDYSNVQGVSSPVHLIRRDGPGTAWTPTDNWTHDGGAQTFTSSGTVPEGQYAVKTGPIRMEVYVDNTAGGASDGSSWTDAYTDLQTAIDNIRSSLLSETELWVAQGIYKPDSEGDSFTITGAKNGLQIYGGFAGTESSRSARDPQANRTILSGDLNGDDADPDSDGIIEDDADLQGGENAHHVLVLDGGNEIGPDVSANVTSATVIDGVVVTAGQADGNIPHNSGGGLYCDGRQGTCSPTLTDVVFSGNVAADNGGAIYSDGENGTSNPVITNAVFAGNLAENGGAIHNRGRHSGTSSPQITNGTFEGNAAEVQGGAIYNDGIHNGTSSPSITNGTFTGNSASEWGGAIYNDAAAADEGTGTVKPMISNTILWGNSAGFGAHEIYNEGSVATRTLAHSIIEGGVNGSGVLGNTINNGGNNLDQDPAFVEPETPAGPDGTYATEDDGLAAVAGSPALDAGDNGAIPSGVTEALTGVARTQDQDGDGTATVNIGAHERRGVLSPEAATGSAANVDGTGADLSGTVEPNSGETTVQAQVYPTADPSDVRTVTASASPFGGATGRSVTVSLDGLVLNTEYKARIVASNVEGGGEGNFVTFTTTSDGYARRIEGTDGTGNDAGWRMLALPAADTDRSALEGHLTFATNSGSILYRWTNRAWAAQTSSGDALPRGRGFMLYFFDDVIDPLDSDGLSLAVGTGAEDQSADKQVTGLSTGETFHLMGNPFDAAFDLSELNLSEQGFQTTVQVLDPSADSYTAVTQSGDQSDVIGAWQGFFVERDPNADTDGTSLTFSTAGKQSGPGTIIGSQSATVADAKRRDEKRLRLGLRLAVVDTTSEDTSPPSPSTQVALTRPPAALDTIEGSAARAQADTESEADTIATGRLGLLLSESVEAGWDEAEATHVGPPGGGQAAVTMSSPLKWGSGESSLARRALASEPYPSESAAATLPVSVRVPDESPAVGATARLGLPEARREALTQRLPAGWTLRLTDTQAGEHTDLLSETYPFSLEKGAGTALETASDSRFRLAVGARSALPVPEGLRLSVPYPNPTTRRATVEYAVPQEKADGARLELYDVLGRRVRTVRPKPGPRTRQLDVSGLASGTYFLRLRTDGAQQTRKMTVVR